MAPALPTLDVDQRTNAVLAYAVVCLLALAGAVSTIRGDVAWTGFALVVVAVVALPAIGRGNPAAVVPWEVALLAALPVLGRAFSTVPVTGALATYLAVGALAMVVATEIHYFTPVRLSDGFAAGFVVVTTIGLSGLWAVLRWAADVTLGTGLLLTPGTPEHVVERALMLEFVASTLAGVLAGVLFVVYVRHRLAPSRRLPEGVAP